MKKNNVALNKEQFEGAGMRALHYTICDVLHTENEHYPFYVCQKEKELLGCDYIDDHWRVRNFSNTDFRKNLTEDETVFQYAKVCIAEQMIDELKGIQSRMNALQVGFFIGPIVKYKYRSDTETHHWSYQWKAALVDSRDPHSQVLIKSPKRYLKRITDAQSESDSDNEDQ